MSTDRSLLYAYPWMPFPRRIIIYLRKKEISSSLVAIVPISDLFSGDTAAPGFPPHPTGSLPILAIPSKEPARTYTYVRQSVAIMNYLDELCDAGLDGFPKSTHPMRGSDALIRARNTELLTSAEECLVAWNPVRTFGTGAGTMSIPVVVKEMLKWIHQGLNAIEQSFQDQNFDHLRKDGDGGFLTSSR